MQLEEAFRLERLRPPGWLATPQWLDAADALFSSLAVHGGAVVLLGASRGVSALAVSHLGFFGDPAGTDHNGEAPPFFQHPAEEKRRVRVAHGAGAGCGYSEDAKASTQSLVYRSGPWVPDELGEEEHEALQAVMAAGQEVCGAVLACVAASRHVRLPAGTVAALAEAPPLDPQRFSASLVKATSYAPAATSAAAQRPASSSVGGDGDGSGDVGEAQPGLLTVLYCPGRQALQVRDYFEAWQQLPSLPEDAVLVLPGQALEHALCGLLPAARHRVVAPAGQPPVGTLAFHLHPAPAARIDLASGLLAAGHLLDADRYPPVTGLELMPLALRQRPADSPSGIERPAVARPGGRNPWQGAGAGGKPLPSKPPATPQMLPVPRSTEAASPLGRGEVQRAKRAKLEGSAAAGSAGVNKGRASGPSQGTAGRAGPAGASEFGVGAAGRAGAGEAAGSGESFVLRLVPTGRLKAQGTEEIDLRVKPTSQFAKGVQAYASKFGLDPTALRFFIPGGAELSPDRTFAENGLSEGCRVLVSDEVLEQ